MEEWLGEGGQAMHVYGMDSPDFVYAASADYDIDCNWKVRTISQIPKAVALRPTADD